MFEIDISLGLLVGKLSDLLLEFLYLIGVSDVDGDLLCNDS